MWKKRMLRSLAGVLAVVLLLGGCTAEPEWSRWRRSFMDTFDTIVELVGYILYLMFLYGSYNAL